MMLRLATRGSRLALWQAEHVRTRLEAAHPRIAVMVHVFRTTGDRITDAPLAAIGGAGLFTSELDARVRAGDADAAVHSLKDVPTIPSDDLSIGAVLVREDPRDAYVPAAGRARTLRELPPHARVGTSSLRRRALLRETRPDLDVLDLRGNLDTRLARLDAGDLDAAVLARAGIRRLDRDDVIGEILEAPPWLPAAGQGAIAILVRADDAAAAALVAPLDDPPTRSATTAERAFLRRLQGGCQVPIGGLAHVTGDTLTLDGFVSDLDGATPLRAQRHGPVAQAAEVGVALADDLLARGARAILDSLRGPVLPASAP
jgi:hydroxymethylbilane synthase